MRQFVMVSLVLWSVFAQAGSGPLMGNAPDFEIAKAAELRKNADYVKGANMVVTQLLPDDTQGRPHQKFIVRLSTGVEITAISNLDMCQRVPVAVGTLVDMGGQFIWTNRGGIIHWLHHDPAGRRPNGYIQVGKQVYCQ